MIINIDTATDTASVCISEDGVSVCYRENNLQKEHASFVHAAIESILQETGKTLQQADAFAVTSGPGSYTGLRVGMATAKGFCYALGKPLITINTLKVMAQAAISAQLSSNAENEILYCPMIDARRMEVFTALYNSRLEAVLSPVAMVVDESSFSLQLQNQPILFFGSGSEKLRTILLHKNARFKNISHSATDLAMLAQQAFNNRQFANLAYAQPDYVKEFYSTFNR